MSITPKWANMPNWAENFIVGGIALVIGMVGTASFTMSERSSLRKQVTALKSQSEEQSLKINVLESELEDAKGEHVATLAVRSDIGNGTSHATNTTLDLPTATRDEKPNSEAVYVTGSGTKYHRKSCSYLRSSSIEIALSDVAGRFSPCSRCSPPSPPQVIDRSIGFTDDTAKSSPPVRNTGGGQCMATTKKGSRCKRSARSNGYCWQHGG